MIYRLAHFIASRIVDWVSAKGLGATPMYGLAGTNVSCWGVPRHNLNTARAHMQGLGSR